MLLLHFIALCFGALYGASLYVRALYGTVWSSMVMIIKSYPHSSATVYPRPARRNMPSPHLHLALHCIAARHLHLHRHCPVQYSTVLAFCRSPIPILIPMSLSPATIPSRITIP